jgi:hypothetical protein
MSNDIGSNPWDAVDIERQWSCRIEADPALGLPPGSVIHYKSFTFAPEGDLNFARVVEPTQMQGVVLSLQFSDSAKGSSADGSAVFVAPGIALCASHVIDEHLEGILLGTTGSIGVCIVGDELQVWRLTHATTIPNCDISIVGLALASAMPSDATFRRASLTTRLPKSGETLTLCGWAPRDPIECTHTDSGSRQFKVRGGMLVSRGAVTACYLGGRDQAMLPWPVVEVDCPAFGAMSGGPVFDRRGYLVGLVCSSFDTELGGGPAYVSLLWPALFAPFMGGWPAALMQGTSTLHGMGEDRCTILGREHIVETCESSGRMQRSIQDWDFLD